MKLRINLAKKLLAVFLLVFSGQALALFMPSGVPVNVDVVNVYSDTGC